MDEVTAWLLCLKVGHNTHGLLILPVELLIYIATKYLTLESMVALTNTSSRLREVFSYANENLLWWQKMPRGLYRLKPYRRDAHIQIGTCIIGGPFNPAMDYQYSAARLVSKILGGQNANACCDCLEQFNYTANLTTVGRQRWCKKCRNSHAVQLLDFLETIQDVDGLDNILYRFISRYTHIPGIPFDARQRFIDRVALDRFMIRRYGRTMNGLSRQYEHRVALEKESSLAGYNYKAYALIVEAAERLWAGTDPNPQTWLYDDHIWLNALHIERCRTKL